MSEAKPIRILIADDHAVVRGGLRLFLLAFEDMQLVGEASNGEEAVTLCEKLHPDILLIDLIMPVLDGISATRLIRSSYPDVQVLVLTSFTDSDLVQEALQAGAISYLLKTASASELAAAIRAAHAGRPTLASEVTQALLNSSRSSSNAGHDLTVREREVLALMVEGFSNTAIAERLVISLSTVKFHVSSILTKLGVSSRAEAVSMALHHHLTDHPFIYP